MLLRDSLENTKEKAPPVAHEFRMDVSISRTRRLFHDYAFCNHFDLFCTFTFDCKKVDRTDFSAVKKALCKFFNNFRSRVDSNFRYMVIPEQHADGAWHFHGFITLPQGICCNLLIDKEIDGVVRRVPNTPGYMHWPAYSERFGFFSAELIRDYDRSVNYCLSYITKSFRNSVFKNKQLLLKSQGLTKPELVFQTMERVSLYRPDYVGEFCSVKWQSADATAPYYRHWTHWYDDEFITYPDFIRSISPWPIYSDVITGEQLAVDIYK